MTRFMSYPCPFSVRVWCLDFPPLRACSPSWLWLLTANINSTSTRDLFRFRDCSKGSLNVTGTTCEMRWLLTAAGLCDTGPERQNGLDMLFVQFAQSAGKIFLQRLCWAQSDILPQNNIHHAGTLLGSSNCNYLRLFKICEDTIPS